MTRPLRGALLVEGHGEIAAAPVFLNGLWRHLGLDPVVSWERPLVRDTALKNVDCLERTLQNLWREIRKFDVLMVVYDADFEVTLAGKPKRKACPKLDGPAAAAIMRAAKLPIPAAVVLPWPEYEHWIVASLPAIQGRPVCDPRSGAQLTSVKADCSTALTHIVHRDGKGAVGRFLESNEYEPTTHQAALTAMLDFAHLQQAEIDTHVPSFGTLCRACRHIHANLGKAGAVYPNEPAAVARRILG
jgi:hypothetical protein